MSTSRGRSGQEQAAPVGERRRARERALGLLYEVEVKGVTADEVIRALPIPPEPYAEQLARGVCDRLADVDRLVSAHTTAWAIDRLPVVDRQLLRLATYELLGEAEVPVAVVIDEAVELAKQYSTDESGRYVNGVLSVVAAQVRPGSAVPS